jgi:hypothetical protein
MSEAPDFDGLDLTHRVVLLGAVELDGEDRTPAHAGEVRAHCSDALASVEGDVLGTLTEAEVARALNELDADGFLDGSRDDTSPSGKGRPGFRLAVAAEDVHDALGDDERVSPLVSGAGTAD